eukprot:6748464-Pyramimonas_sp.AAC.1
MPNQFLPRATPAASIGAASLLSVALEDAVQSIHSPGHGIWAGRAYTGRTSNTSTTARHLDKHPQDRDHSWLRRSVSERQTAKKITSFGGIV